MTFDTTKTNKPGLIYDPNNTRAIWAEDWNAMVSALKSIKGDTTRVFRHKTNVYAVNDSGMVIASGIAGTDDSRIIQAGIDAAASGTTVFISGQFVPATQIVINKSLNIVADQGTTFQWDIAGPDLFSCKGSIVGTTTLTTDAVKGGITVSCADTSLITDNLLVLIHDDAVRSAPDYSQITTGELHKVMSVSEGAVSLQDPLVNGYTVTLNAKCEIIAPIAVTFTNVNIFSDINKTAYASGISISYGINCKITNCKIRGMGLRGIEFYNCYNSTVAGCIINNCERIGYGYGISINNGSAFTNVHHNTITQCRHCIAHGASVVPFGQPRDSLISNNFFLGSTISSVIDAHPSVESAVISNNIIISPTSTVFNIHVGIKDAIITGNKIVGGRGLTARGSLKRCNWIISNNHFLNTEQGFYAGNVTGTPAWDSVRFVGNIGSIVVPEPSSIAELVKL